MSTTYFRTACAALIGVALCSTTVFAQSAPSPKGWPGAADSSQAKPVSTSPAPRRVAAVAPKTPAITAPVAKTASPAPRVTREAEAIVIPASPVDLVHALQEQSVLLARLASELENDRRIIAEHQRTIQALSEKVAVAPTPAPAPAAPAAARAAAPALPVNMVDTAGSKIRIGGLVQGWYSASDGGGIDTFRLRRTELKVSGEISPRARWTVMLDPLKTTAALQDAFVALQRSPALTIEVGQQKLPLGFEGTQSSSKLDTVERTLFITDKARGGGYADIRDLGVMARGKVAGGQVEYAAGVFNGLGESMNDTDKNEQKALAVRAVVRPRAVKGLQMGGSFAQGAFKSDETTRRIRQGFEASFVRGIFSARSEVMLGADGIVRRRGYYAQSGLRATKRLEAIFRTDVWDSDTRSESNKTTVTERDWLTGLNWQVSGQTVLLQLNYVRKTFKDVQAPRNVLLANLQTAW